MNKIEKILLNSFFTAFVLFVVFVLSSDRLARAEDWGPMLIPPQPVEHEDDFAPSRLSKSKSAQQLPSKTRSARRAEMMDFDTSLEPREVILPSRFLNEDSSDEPVRPKPAKKSRPSYELETDDAVSPPRARSPKPAPVLDEEEYVMDEYPEYPVGGRLGARLAGGFSHPLMAETEYPLNEQQGGGGLYNQCSPALESCYVGPPIIKPFGTGMLDNLAFFGGVTGFKSELDGGHGGSFGFTEGFNWSGPATPQCTVSAQFGFRAVQADINGSAVSNKSFRSQYFVTAGFFKRDLSYPLQGGAVFDWFQDDYYGTIEMQQVRCEVSLRTFSNLEYGFLGGFGISDDGNARINARENAYHGTVDLNYKVRAQNYYLLFLRKHWGNGGSGELRAGATDHGDVVLSGVGEFPVNDCLSFNGGFSTMIPRDGKDKGRREVWDVSVGIVFYFRGGACTKPCNPCRPMFDVAQNGSFMSQIRRK